MTVLPHLSRFISTKSKLSKEKYKMYTTTGNVNRLKEHLMISEIKGMGDLRESPCTAKLPTCGKELKKK